MKNKIIKTIFVCELVVLIIAFIILLYVGEMVVMWLCGSFILYTLIVLEVISIKERLDDIEAKKEIK